MNPETRHIPQKRILLLIGIISIVSFVIATVAIAVLYHASINQQKQRLLETARARARLIEAVARFDANTYKGRPEEAFAATLSQIREAHRTFGGFAETGEFTLAELRGRDMVFLLALRHGGNGGAETGEALVLPFMGTHAAPMMRALGGLSGTITGPDYRGTTVVAAHEPVRWGDRHIGIVAKIDLAEIRAPFLKAGAVTGSATLGVLLLGILLFLKAGSPIIRRLEESENRYHLLFETMSDAIMIADAETGVITDANSTAEILLGLPREELIGKHIEEIHAPEKALYYGTLFRELVEKGGGHASNIEILRPDGGTIPVDISSGVIELNGRKLIQGIFRDATARRKTEELLQTALAHTEALIDVNPDILYVFNTTSRLTKWSKGLERLTGLTEKGLAMRHALDLVCEEDSPLFENAIRQIFESGEASVELRLLDGKGEKVPYLCNGAVLKDENGAVMGFTGTGRNIAKLKKAEDELRAQKEKAQKYLDIVGTIIIAIDTERKVTLINRKGCEMLGYEEKEIVGKNWFDNFIPADAREKVGSVFARLVGGDSNGEYFENDIITKEGERRVIAWHNTILKNEDGTIAGTLSSGADITEQIKREEELRRAKERAETATLQKDKFVSLVAHDLRAPLFNIICSLKLLKDGGVEKSDAPRLLNSSINAGENLLALISDVLNISRLNTGQIRMERKFTDAHLAVAKIFANLEYLAESKNITLVNNVPRKTRIYADSTLLAEAVQNLVANAIKFSESGDSVAVFIPDGEPSTIAVSDTGRGMKKEEVAALFAYEKKTSTIGTDGEMGTGYGLPLTNDILKGHGGALAIESEEGKGSVFYLRFPFVKPLVLMVDDDDSMRLLFKERLKTLDLDVIEARDGEEGLRMAAEAHPHIIIADIHMPGMNGFAMLDALKKDPETKDIPVIILTVDSSMETREKAFSMGASDVMNKTVKPSDFAPRVTRYVG